MDRDDPRLQQTCWLLSFATTRSLKVIYFDGTSAANTPTGPVDTQQLIAWGQPGNTLPRDEGRLVKDLCKWGKNFGVDGFVRYISTRVLRCLPVLNTVAGWKWTCKRSPFPPGSALHKRL